MIEIDPDSSTIRSILSQRIEYFGNKNHSFQANRVLGNILSQRIEYVDLGTRIMQQSRTEADFSGRTGAPPQESSDVDSHSRDSFRSAVSSEEDFLKQNAADVRPKHQNVNEEEDDDRTCLICFEECDETTELPCRCRITYCPTCWDRCLSESVQRSGRPKCPTCRTTIGVDYDPDLGRLVFSAAVDDGGVVAAEEPWTMVVEDGGVSVGGEEQDSNNFRARLAAQSRPRQIQLLRKTVEDRHRFVAVTGSGAVGPSAPPTAAGFGAMIGVKKNSPEEDVLPLPAPPHSTPPKTSTPGETPPAHASPDHDGDPRVHDDEDDEFRGFSCVCGGKLIRTDLRTRVMQILPKTNLDNLPEGPVRDQMIDRMMELGVILCDVCDQKIEDRGGQRQTDENHVPHVLTCINGAQTVLHAHSYDICEACVRSHSQRLCGSCGRSNAEKRCSRCKLVYYCSLECQRGDWKKHKGGCNKGT